MASNFARVTRTQERNGNGKLQPCVYVECLESGDVAGPVWGQGERSILRVLGVLTKKCTCKATFHEKDPDQLRNRRMVGKG